MIYAVVGALIIGLSLGLLGSGGSILTIPVLVYLLHHEDKVAIAESLAIVGGIAAIGASQYAIAKAVSWRLVLLFALPGMFGSVLGAWIAAGVPGFVQLLVFSGVMLIASWKMWKRSRGKPETQSSGSDDKQKDEPHWALIGMQGLMVGVLTGFVGVGGGFLIVPALVLFARLDMKRAIGSSLVIITLNSASALIKYQDVLDSIGQSLDWSTIGMFILIGTIGSIIGKHLNSKFSHSALQRGFAVFLLVMATFIVLKEGRKLLNPDDTHTGQGVQPVSLVIQEHVAQENSDE